MTIQSPPPTDTYSHLPDFTPVPMQRVRHDGWTVPRQRRFVEALSVTESVGAAAQMARMSRKSAYQLRTRSDAQSFAQAWDFAVEVGRSRIFDAMMDQAVNGVTTFTLKLGGAVDIRHGMDGRLVAAQMKALSSGKIKYGRPNAIGSKATKGDLR